MTKEQIADLERAIVLREDVVAGVRLSFLFAETLARVVRERKRLLEALKRLTGELPEWDIQPGDMAYEAVAYAEEPA